MTLPKPRAGAACNACGHCCRMVVCSAGSFVLGLVDRYGERASGPCPALIQEGEREVCGIMRRPTDYLDGGVTPLRQAWGVLIGAGSGCDDVSDIADDDEAEAIQAAIQQAYLDCIGIEAVRRAVENVLGARERRRLKAEGAPTP